MVTVTLPISDDEKTRLGGVNEQNFIRVEEVLGVRLITRNHGLTVKADSDDVLRTAKAALESMLEALHSGQHLSEFYLDALLMKPVAGKTSSPPPLALGKPVLIDRYGNAVQPKTRGQADFVQRIRENDMVFAAGPAGTGKTFLAVAMAVQALEKKLVDRVILCRPAVESGESLGFLPGMISDKIAPYMRPLHDSLSIMLSTEKLREYEDSNTIEIAPLAYMRGRTLSKSFIILDEAQNTTILQMKMFLTRIGVASKTVLTGDES